MSYVKYLAALIAVCTLVIPAFSMMEDGHSNDNKYPAGPMGPDGKQQVCQCQDGKCLCQDKDKCQDGCQCEDKQTSEQSKMLVIKHNKDDNAKYSEQQTCPCQDKKIGENPANMMGDKSLDGKQLIMRHKIKSMMEENGQFGEHMCHKPIKSMMGDHSDGGIKAVVVTVKVLA